MESGARRSAEMWLTARLGDAAATIAALMGLWAWPRLDLPRRIITIFCALSVMLGIWQASLSADRLPSALPGNLWDAALIVLLLPALLAFTRKQLRAPFAPMAFVVSMAWIYAHFWGGTMDQFSDPVSLAIYLVISFCGATLLFQCMDQAESLLTQPCCLRAMAVFIALLVDALNSLVLINGAAVGRTFCMVVMVARNLVWALAYLALGFSLWMPQERKPAKRADDPQRRKSDQPPQRMNRSTLMGESHGRV